jgi:hypothetical protein
VGWSAARHILELDWSRNPDTKGETMQPNVFQFKKMQKNETCFAFMTLVNPRAARLRTTLP